MKKSKNMIKISAAAFAAMMSASSFAVEPTSGFTVSPMIGKFSPDRERGLDSYGEFGQIGFGYEFASRWGLELNYLLGDGSLQGSDIGADLEALKLDAMYYVGDEALQPYLVFGAGTAKYELDSGLDLSESEAVGNLGVGLRYLVSEAVALKGDIRVLQGLESGDSDLLAGLGAVFKFGGRSSPRSTPAPAPAPVTVSDRDNDGVPDSVDRCPNSPAGSQVDSTGCPLDSDGDGVANAIDKCPDTEAGARVDATGCYEVLKESVSVALAVLFETGSANVVPSSYDEIRKVAEFLREYPLTNVVIEGHTDDRGAAAFNQRLSQQRAESVSNVLVDVFNVDRGRVSSVGYGEERPIATNDTAEGRAKNRRVTAVVSATVEKVVK